MFEPRTTTIVSAQSRRTFLVTAIATTCSLGRHAQATVGASRRKILVVGGGFAGLMAANRLRECRYSVLVLEANDSVGGRVKSVKHLLKGKVLEAGGELVGPNQPLWMAHAKKFGLKFLPAADPANEGPIPVVLDNKRLSPKAAVRVLDEIEAFKRKLVEDSQSVDAAAPWKHPQAEKLDATSLADRISRDADLSDQTRKLLLAYFGHYNGVPTDRQSLLGLYASLAGGGHDRYWSETDTLRVQGGAQQLAFALAESLGKENVRLSTAVTAVRTDDRGVTVETARERFQADEVILALPPRVLKSLRFDPALKLANYQMGNATKHLLITRDRSWRPDAPDALCENGLTWETTAGQPDPGRALLLLQSNAEAKRLCSAKPDERLQLSAETLAPVYPKLLPERDVLFDWNSHPFSLGSYSFPAPGQITSLKDSGSTLLPGKLHCAGEYLAYSFPGYMEGALESGLAAADEIISRDR